MEIHSPIHSTAQEQLSAYLHKPSHCLLITSKPGGNTVEVGQELIERLASKYKLLGVDILRIEAIKNSIGIDDVRQVHQFTKHKSVNGDTLGKIIFIPEAEKMTHEAQNSILKILEEPPSHIAFILTTTEVESILDTILSRLKTVELLPLSLDVLKDALNVSDDSIANKAYMLSGGNVNHFKQFLSNKNPPAYDEAKQLLASKPYQRLLSINALAKDRSKTLETLHALETLLSVLIRQAAVAKQTKKIEKLSLMYSHVNHAHENIIQNGNIKLHLTNLFSNL